jgi:hypothetical protein
MWLQLVVALGSFGTHTPCATLVRNIPMSNFNVIALVPYDEDILWHDLATRTTM